MGFAVVDVNCSKGEMKDGGEFFRSGFQAMAAKIFFFGSTVIMAAWW